MKYYQLRFNPEITVAFQMFKQLVGQKYGKNAWSSSDDSFYLVVTPDSEEQLRNYVDVSIDPAGSSLPGAATLGLVIEEISLSERELPAAAREWLARQVAAVTEIGALLNR